jgi:hypothetical protein
MVRVDWWLLGIVGFILAVLVAYSLLATDDATAIAPRASCLFGLLGRC